MLHFKGHSLTAENMTFGNYCNVDLIYPRNPSLNRPKRRNAIVQAQVGICENTDRLFARNCRFISRLNLCPLSGARRSLYKDCYFECTDDALSGSAVYLDCRFTFFSGKPFYSTASTGAIFPQLRHPHQSPWHTISHKSTRHGVNDRHPLDFRLARRHSVDT